MRRRWVLGSLPVALVAETLSRQHQVGDPSFELGPVIPFLTVGAAQASDDVGRQLGFFVVLLIYARHDVGPSGYGNLPYNPAATA
jgi:hypothetical protein